LHRGGSGFHDSETPEGFCYSWGVSIAEVPSPGQMGPGSAMSAEARSNLAAVGAGLIGAPLVVGAAASGYYAAPLLVPTLERVGLRLLSPVRTLGGLAAWYTKLKHKADVMVTTGTVLTHLPGYLGWWWDNPLGESSGGGGPRDPLTSTESPLSLEQKGKASEHTSSPAAAGNSAHGGRRSGSKPRKGKRCPPGYYWDRRALRCRRKSSNIDEFNWRLRNA